MMAGDHWLGNTVEVALALKRALHSRQATLRREQLEYSSKIPNQRGQKTGYCQNQ
jgi:hypothetical protein